MEKLKVVELQSQLAIRNMDVRGTKSVLAARLKDAVESEGINVDEFVLSFRQRRQPVDQELPAVLSQGMNETHEDSSHETKSSSNASTVSAMESIRAKHTQGPINQVRHSGQMRLMRRLGCDVTCS